MDTFTGLEYILIDLANNFGLDKLTWKERITWTLDNESNLVSMIDQADNKFLFIKGIDALKDAKKGNPTGFIMGLDSTASGLQIMATLIGCHKTASNVNLVNTGNREDIYTKIANEMNKLPNINVTRSDVKKPIMTTYYGSKAQPKSVFGEDTPELEAFYKVLDNELPGAQEVMNDIQQCWNSLALEHKWTLPDGHIAKIKVEEAVDKRIEIDELNHARLHYRAYINKPSKYGTSLAANIVHSIDGYIVREMVREANKQGFQLATIHDSFWTSPNYMNNVRNTYNNILANIANSNLLEDILNEITNHKGKLKKYSTNLSKEILNSNYSLS